MLNNPGPKFKQGIYQLVRHPGDYECESVVNKYKKFLKDVDNTFKDFRFDDFISAFDRIETNEKVKKWLEEFRLRYFFE